jgi:hypothetical protein
MKENKNRGLFVAVIIIGSIILVLLLIPRINTRGTHAYQYNMLTASTVSFDQYPNTYRNTTNGGYYTIQRFIPKTTYSNTYTTHTHSKSQSEILYEYTYQQQYPDGCTAYTTYSATTGLLCR